MIDLAQSLYLKQYYFKKFSIHGISINPETKEYPAIFLICRDHLGYRKCEFIVGLSFEQFNQMLMHAVENRERMALSGLIGEFLSSEKKSTEISIPNLIGAPLVLEGLDLSTCIKRFELDSDDENKALYYFQLVDM
jgi:hypothetical protein